MIPKGGMKNIIKKAQELQNQMEKRKLFIRAIRYIINNMKKCRICKEYKMVSTRHYLSGRH